MRLRKCFKFDAGEQFFQGHFPGTPILPGVMQLHFAHRAVEDCIGRAMTLREVRRMKFLQIISPGDEVTLELEGDGQVTYRFLKGDELCSSGVLVY